MTSSPCPTLPNGKPAPGCRAREAQALQQRWLQRLAFGPDPAQDQLVQLWLGIFPVSWRQLKDVTLLNRQVDTIRRSLSGTYTDLLQAMVVDPALQTSLNGLKNLRSQPNENLARELLELFSLGEGHYGEQDVINAARALTGYRLTPEGAVALDPARHDDGNKTILGRTAPFDALALVTWLCEQPATARHITRRLWPSLVGPPPKSGRVEAIAAAWQRQNLSLPWLVSTLRTSPEAQAARGQRVDSPITMVVRSLSLLDSRHPDALVISRQHLTAMGQPPFDPPSVKGWPVNTEWINLRWFDARRRGLQNLLADEEVWNASQPPSQLLPSLTPTPPLTFSLPVTTTRETLGLLFSDPVWNLS